MSANTNLKADTSFYVKLASEDKPTNARDGATLLEVDTATWYVFYKGTWYAQ